MTLTEAIASGRKFSRPALVGELGYFGGDDIGDDVVLSAVDITATDYVLEPAGRTLTHADLAQAWDSVSRDFNNVKTSGNSQLFAKLSARLFGN